MKFMIKTKIIQEYNYQQNGNIAYAQFGQPSPMKSVIKYELYTHAGKTLLSTFDSKEAAKAFAKIYAQTEDFEEFEI